MKAFASEQEFDEAYEKFLAGRPQAGEEVRDSHERMEASFRDYLDIFGMWVFRHAYECGYAAAISKAADGGDGDA